MKEVGKRVFVFSLVALLLVFSFQFAVAVEETAAKTDTTASAGTTATAPSTTNTPTSTTTTAQTTTPATTTNTQTTAPAAGTTTSADTSASASTSAIPEEFKDEKLDRSTGLTPGSFFYFWEKYVREPFRSDDENAKQKVAEVKAAVEKGDFASAKQALERYKEYASKVEQEADPAKKDKIQKDAAAIKNAIKEVENKIPEGERKEIVGEIVNQAELNAKAVAVADKIKVLCEELSKIDPKKYADTCRSDKNENTPKWQRDLDKKLTGEQEKEAREFGNIMSQCMKTQGRECRCKDISIPAFANKCSLVAPLATKCEDGDDESCEIMADATADMEDLLPEHLQDVLAEIEGDVRDDQFDHFMPPECKKANAKTPKECMIVMARKHAPKVCVDALEKGDLKFTNERDFREKCEELAFAEEGPEECIKAGIKDHRKCGTFMCENNLPQECKDTGLTCDRPEKVFKKCDVIMRSQGAGKGKGPPAFAHAKGLRCREIQNSEDRLKCFDSVDTAVNGAQDDFDEEFGFSGEHTGGEFAGDFRGRGEPGKGPRGRGPGFPEECKKAGIDGKNADDGERCRKVIMASSQERHDKMREYTENFARQCRAKNGRWDCSFGDLNPSNPCECFIDEQQKFGDSKGDFNNRGSPQGGQGNFPEQCRQANALDPDSCRRVMEEAGRQQRDFRPPENFKPPEGFQPPQGQQPQCPPGQVCPPQGQQQPQQPPAGTEPKTESQSGTSTTSGAGTSTTSGTTTGGSTSTSTNTGSTTSGGTTSGTSGGTSGSAPAPAPASAPVESSPPPATGGVITGRVVGDNDFLKYYFGR